MPAVAVGRFVCWPPGGFRLRQLREAEVEDLDAAVPRHEDVLGLQVAVDDPFLVRRGEAVGDLDRLFDRLAHRQRAAGKPGPQRLAFEQLLDDVGRAVVLADVVNGGDVGMVEDAGRARLLLEALQALRIAREGAGQDLDRDVAAEARIARAEDLSHPSRADGGEDLVGPETGAGLDSHELARFYRASSGVPASSGPGRPTARGGGGAGRVAIKELTTVRSFRPQGFPGPAPLGGGRGKNSRV